MKVLNIHKRILNKPVSEVAKVLATVSTREDKVWPKANWPKMKFKDGIKVGAKGGHGPIRYSVERFDPSSIIQFRFSRPHGFHGVHKFEVKALAQNITEVKHVIDVKTKGMGTFKWLFVIRSLHDALIEDGLDNLENIMSDSKKSTEWSIWVKFLRKIIG